MNHTTIGQPNLNSLIGPGFALLCWTAVVALGYAAWRRRRGRDASNLLVVAALWLAIRLGLLIIGLPVQGRPGDAWLNAALDLAGLVLLAWPFLAPPLPTRWADGLAGGGLMAVALMCGLSLWHWARGALGLPLSQSQPGLTWACTTLVLAGLAALNRPRRRPGNRLWTLTAIGALLAGAGGLLFPLPVTPSLRALLTAAAAVFAAAWLTWLERQQREVAPAAPNGETPPAPQETTRLPWNSSALFKAPDLEQLLQATIATLSPILEIQQAVLFLVDDENQGDLRQVARWSQAGASDAFFPLSRELGQLLKDAFARGSSLNVIRSRGKRGLNPLAQTLGAGWKAALTLPLTSEQGARGVLLLGHAGATLDTRQLQLCDILAEQTAIAVRYIQLRANVEQQSRSMAHLVRRREQETGQLRSILESIGDGVIVSDANDQVILANDAALNILGAERDGVTGQPFGQILGRMAPAGEVGIIGTLTDNSSYGTEAIFQVAERVVQTSMSPVENGAGVPLGVVAVLRDITALTQAEAAREQLLTDLQERGRQLEEAAEQLREMDRLKSQFITNMSHELRTPLNHIIGFSAMMLKEMSGPLTDMQRQDLETIQKGGKHLMGLITDILDISQIWAGKMDVTLGAVDLPALLEETMTLAASLIEEKPIEMKQSLDPEISTIQADEKRIRQVLVNLLDNAAKYTKKGQITVS
ncbi:MAG: histidine kinase dimerization/phospho-acceptor domain-containing protein, partial [Chloroflexota bacterium]|nr:histidine kinase dimerization/phospho-acceptor domain-containing protein [Chloroflexota bacterium]